MSKMRCIVTTILILTSWPWPVRCVDQQKRTLVHQIHIENRSTAATLVDLWNRSDIVIEGVVAAERPADVQEETGPPIVFTEFEIDLKDVFKRDVALAASTRVIELRRLGGTREHADHVDVYETEGYPPFHRGQRFIMFLRRIKGNACIETTGGPDSVFEVHTRAIDSNGRSRLTESLLQLTDDELRSRLHRLGGGQ